MSWIRGDPVVTAVPVTICTLSRCWRKRRQRSKRIRPASKENGAISLVIIAARRRRRRHRRCVAKTGNTTCITLKHVPIMWNDLYAIARMIEGPAPALRRTLWTHSSRINTNPVYESFEKNITKRILFWNQNSIRGKIKLK